jgi:Protein of unknown function (DUF2946)
MDEIVKQAMAKWPNVPHCYGWLALDGRGGWRMRDERSQTLKLAGDRINNAALLGFINRNYTHDDRGRWYFQNGPQRVYVNLDATPFIARTDPTDGFVLHTGAVLREIDAVWLTDGGRLLLKSGDIVAALDDRDTAQCLPLLRIDGEVADDERLLAWLDAAGDVGKLTLELTPNCGGATIAVKHIASGDIPARFGFVPQPTAD